MECASSSVREMSHCEKRIKIIKKAIFIVGGGKELKKRHEPPLCEDGNHVRGTNDATISITREETKPFRPNEAGFPWAPVVEQLAALGNAVQRKPLPMRQAFVYGQSPRPVQEVGTR